MSRALRRVNDDGRHTVSWRIDCIFRDEIQGPDLRDPRGGNEGCTEMRSKSGPGAMHIAYCGPIAEPGKPARGGYEAANRCLIDDLRLRGVQVIEFPYPVALGSTVTKAVAYVLRFVHIGWDLVRTRRHWDLLHLTPLKRGFLYFEALLCLVARGLGKRVVFDIRAGSFVELYQERGPIYRAVVDALIRHAGIVALEGKEDLAFTQTRRGGPIVYLPNYVSKLQAPSGARDRSSTPLRLVYLGRIVPEKGIELAIDALKTLLGMGLNASLEVIGAGQASYVATLTERTTDLPVVWTGPLAPDATRARLADAHVFVFPTRHSGEGHSNALTEAMAEGLVPVCSDHGFNRSVVADAGRILPREASAADYAEAIASIWQSGQWPQLSIAAYERVADNFTGDVVVSSLIRHYEAKPQRDRVAGL